jgi:hypothetical protein
MNFHPDKQLFKVASAEDQTTDPWITKPALFLYTMGDQLRSNLLQKKGPKRYGIPILSFQVLTSFQTNVIQNQSEMSDFLLSNIGGVHKRRGQEEVGE